LLAIAVSRSTTQNWGKYEPYNKDVNLEFAERESDFPFPVWESDEDKGAVKREWQKLGTIGTAPNYLAAQVLAYAKDHEEGERVPQALYFAVRAMHLGCTNAETTRLSKAAFNFLHEHSEERVGGENQVLLLSGEKSHLE
jgi:hypothetical protein